MVPLRTPIMNSRFEPDLEIDQPASEVRPRQPNTRADAETEYTGIEETPQQYDASEQQFAASLEAPSARFVVEEDFTIFSHSSVENEIPVVREDSAHGLINAPALNAEPLPDPVESPFKLSQPDLTALKPDSWRQEVAARLSKYNQGRKPREPKYPSLRLKFEPNEPIPNPHSQVAKTTDLLAPSREAAARKVEVEVRQAEPSILAEPRKSAVAEITGRLLEFPRSFFPPVRPADELAEPVFDRPRILDVPELLPLPPALGGILIEPDEVPVDEKRPGFELPLQPARLGRRLWAAATDAVVILVALASFEWIFVKMTKISMPLRASTIMGALIAGLFWAGYQYLLLVYCGSTPGLKAAKLRLSLFDGSPVPRKLRIWRVVASILSALSLGLGYAWCFLDEDQLCWHDRITRTYMAPVEPYSSNKMI